MNLVADAVFYGRGALSWAEAMDMPRLELERAASLLFERYAAELKSRAI